MPITVKVGELVNAVPGLQTIAALENLPLRAAYDCAKLLQKMSPDIQGYDAAKNKLFEKLGEESEDGKTRSIPEDKRDEFFEELKPVIEKEVTIEASVVTLPETLIGLKPADLINIMPFIEVAGNGEAKPAG